MQTSEILVALDANQGGFLSSPLFMFLMMGAVIWFMVILPQRKEAKEHAALIASLQRGDRVVTNAGLHGKVHEARSDTLVLEISPNSFLTVDRDAVRRKLAADAPKADA
jgi:preprotein translocase subunit YajC